MQHRRLIHLSIKTGSIFCTSTRITDAGTRTSTHIREMPALVLVLAQVLALELANVRTRTSTHIRGMRVLVEALELANARTRTSTHIREMPAEQFTQERQSRLTPLYVPSFRHSWKMMFFIKHTRLVCSNRYVAE